MAVIGDLNSSVGTFLGEACGQAAQSVRTELSRGAKKQAQGQAGPREERFTGDVANALDDLGDALTRRLADRTGFVGPEQTLVRVSFTTNTAPQGEEKDFGLDLGVRIIVQTPGYTADKAILVQCKRMVGTGASGSFPKLAGDGERQAADMLRISPAAFFFFFNAGDALELHEMMVGGVRSSFQDADDPGVAVVPATRILAMSEAARRTGAKMPTRAAECLRGATPLGTFISGLFAPCWVGDPRRAVVQLATPPSEREAVEALDADVPGLVLKARRFHKLRVVAQPRP